MDFDNLERILILKNGFRVENKMFELTILETKLI